MKLLLIVDMINGFLKEGNMAFASGMAVVDPILELATNFVAKDYDIAAFRDEHAPDSLEFRTYPTHCLKGSSESELIDELKIFDNKIIDIPKASTNGVNTQAFQALLKEKSYEESVVVGVCSDICVLQSVLSLITQFYEHNIDTKVSVATDAIATFDNSEHNANDYHNFAIDLMRNASANISDSKTIINQK